LISFYSSQMVASVNITKYTIENELTKKRKKTKNKQTHKQMAYTYLKQTNYRQHCAQRKPPVFNLLIGRFWSFSPRRGDTLHQWGWKLARKRGPFQISPHRCNDKGVGPPKLKFLLRFDQNVGYKRPGGPLLHAKVHPHRCNDKGLPRGRLVTSHLKFGTKYPSISGFALPYQLSNVISKRTYLNSILHFTPAILPT